MTESTAKPRVSKKQSGSSTSPFRRLLVAVDLTVGADRVLGRVPLLPLADDARVTLLHVVSRSLRVSEQQRAERDAKKALSVEVRHLQKHLPKNVSIEPLVRLGVAASEIAACANDVNAELVVMGRGGGRALRDIFLGSSAERVIRQARRPTLVVRLAPRGAYGRPALAVDLDQTAHEVVRLMLRVLPPPRPPVEVIHAFTDPYQRPSYPSLPEDEAEERKDELRAVADRALARLLALAMSKANVRPGHEPIWRTRVLCGPARLVVEKAVAKAGADLLVLGTRGHSGAAYLFLGTVAGDLLRAAKCDVLVVPPAASRRGR